MGLVAVVAHYADLCVQSDCDAGSVAVPDLVNYWQNLPAGQQAQYAPMVNSIVGGWNVNNDRPWYDRFSPFSSYCCTAAKIGDQAILAIQAMVAGTGYKGPAVGVDPSTNTAVDAAAAAANKIVAATGDSLTAILSALKWAALAAAIGVAGYVAIEGYEKVKNIQRAPAMRPALTGARRQRRLAR